MQAEVIYNMAIKQIAGRDVLGDFAPEFAKLKQMLVKAEQR